MLTLIPVPTRYELVDSFPSDMPLWSLWAELAANAIWFFALKIGRRFTAVLFAASLFGFLAIAWGRGGFDIGNRAGVAQLTGALICCLGWFGVGVYISIEKPRLTGNERIVRRLPTNLFGGRTRPQAVISA